MSQTSNQVNDNRLLDIIADEEFVDGQETDVGHQRRKKNVFQLEDEDNHKYGKHLGISNEIKESKSNHENSKARK